MCARDELRSVCALAHWRLQFNRVGRGAEETLLHLLWPGMRNAPTDNARWQDPAGRGVLSIDLGQRAAAAAAVIELRADGKFSADRKPLPFALGRTGNHLWQAAVKTARLLRLPGEDRILEAHEKIPGLTKERSGKSGRLATREERTRARTRPRLRRKRAGETSGRSRQAGRL